MAVYRKNALPVSYYEEIFEHFNASVTSTTSQNKEQLFLALRTVNDVEKAIISHYLEDFNYQEIATISGLSDNNVGVRLNRIKTQLNQILK